MADNLSKEQRRKNMSRIKSKETKIEIAFRKALWKFGFRYSKNSGKYLGKPDLALPKYKTVIFVDGCFWHGCKKHWRLPASNKKYWSAKIQRNIARRKEVSKFYKKQKWQIIRIWEHDLKNKNLIPKIATKLLKNLR